MTEEKNKSIFTDSSNDQKINLKIVNKTLKNLYPKKRLTIGLLSNEPNWATRTAFNLAVFTGELALQQQHPLPVLFDFESQNLPKKQQLIEQIFQCNIDYTFSQASLSKFMVDTIVNADGTGREKYLHSGITLPLKMWVDLDKAIFGQRPLTLPVAERMLKAFQPAEDGIAFVPLPNITTDSLWMKHNMQKWINDNIDIMVLLLNRNVWDNGKNKKNELEYIRRLLDQIHFNDSRTVICWINSHGPNIENIAKNIRNTARLQDSLGIPLFSNSSGKLVPLIMVNSSEKEINTFKDEILSLTAKTLEASFPLKHRRGTYLDLLYGRDTPVRRD